MGLNKKPRRREARNRSDIVNEEVWNYSNIRGSKGWAKGFAMIETHWNGGCLESQASEAMTAIACNGLFMSGGQQMPKALRLKAGIDALAVCWLIHGSDTCSLGVWHVSRKRMIEKRCSILCPEPGAAIVFSSCWLKLGILTQGL